MTFDGRTSANLMWAVADEIDKAERERGLDVHTVILELNGQHGQFDVHIRGTNSDMEECAIDALGFKSGGVENVRFTEDVSGLIIDRG